MQKSTYAIAIEHFAASAGEIKNHLGDNQMELNFFWTTGRDISKNSDYAPNLHVEVGGAEYGDKFFPYLEQLLNNSPKNLKINFVCDTITFNSNQSQIKVIQNTHPNRFSILPIERVIENLLHTFTLTDQKSKIRQVFKNATEGLPVIASDIYRIIGMVFGQDTNLVKDIANTRYTYCDVDAFCFGMESPKHLELVDALFKEVNKAPFYFGRSRNNNDIIKLCIKDLNIYKMFCDNILNKLDLDKVLPKSNQSIINYYLSLHDVIKKCEVDSKYCCNIKEIIPEPNENITLEVMMATGPIFLQSDNITCDLEYPHICAGEWYDATEILNYNIARHVSTKPRAVLDWGFDENSPQDEEICKNFDQSCDEYRKLLNAYSYARRFGEKHPFNIRIKQYLIADYPYIGNSFSNLLKQNFAMYQKDKKINYKIDLLADMLESQEDYQVNTIYIDQASNNQLKYQIITTDKGHIEGTLNIKIEGSLNRLTFKIKQEILKEMQEKNLPHFKVKPGLSYEAWAKLAAQSIMRSGSHYQVLNSILNNWGIELPKLSLDIYKETKGMSFK